VGSPVADSVASANWLGIQEIVPQTVQVVEARQATPQIEIWHAELERRRSSADHTSWQTRYLVIEGLSRFRDLRKSDDDFGFGSLDRDKRLSAGQMLGEILREGPSVGMHAIIWCDSYNNVDRWFGRQLLREIDMRVVLQMNAGDSSHLIDSPAGAKLGNNRALFYSDERGTIEKFRPYAIPSPTWIDHLKQQFAPPQSPVEPELAEDINLWQIS
jgi:DNA segregation ATPase FtsK/SpoIIIE, S-DNA-T family